MKITKASDYALMLLAYLAGNAPGEKASVREVAASCHIPQRFLATIGHRLSKAGLVRSRKGSHGGIWLARPGAEITLREVLEAIEGPIRIVDCQNHLGSCDLEGHCIVKSFWDGAHEKILESLGSTTIDELARGARSRQGGTGETRSPRRSPNR